jgi:hypothetical protein
LGIGETCNCGGEGCNCVLGVYGIPVTGELTAEMKEKIEIAFDDLSSDTQRDYFRGYLTEIRIVPGEINVTINGTVLVITGTPATGTIYRTLRDWCTEKGID